MITDGFPFSFLVLPDTLPGMAELFGTLGLYVFFSWLVCVSAAFCRVERVHLTVGLLAIGLSVVMGNLLSRICELYLPHVATAFTPQGLLLVSMAAASLLCFVPLVQMSWHVSYSRGILVLGGAVMIFLTTFAVFHSLVHSPDTLPDRLSVRIFSDQR